MRAIAKRWFLGALATAQPDGLFLSNGKFHRLKVGAFMGAVTQGLLFGFAAGTPPVITGFELDTIGYGLWTIGL